MKNLSQVLRKHKINTPYMDQTSQLALWLTANDPSINWLVVKAEVAAGSYDNNAYIPITDGTSKMPPPMYYFSNDPRRRMNDPEIPEGSIIRVVNEKESNENFSCVILEDRSKLCFESIDISSLPKIYEQRKEFVNKLFEVHDEDILYSNPSPVNEFEIFLKFDSIELGDIDPHID